MKVAIVHPTNWPQVRRGTERFMNEFASYLGERGHQVKIVCSHAGARKLVKERWYEADYYRSLWRNWMAKVGVLDYHVFPLTTIRSLMSERFDVVHCFNFTDSLAAGMVARVRPAVVILHLASIPPTVPYRRSLSTGGALLRRAIQVADQVVTVGATQRKYFEARFGRKCVAIPVPVNTDFFALSNRRDHKRPIILCASALEDRRKGGRLLMRAFNQVKEVRPLAELHISSRVSSDLRQTLLSLVDERWRGDVRFLGAGELADLPALFGSAAVLVLPSLWEAFSMVLVESLATGTPVIATNERPGYHELVQPLIGRTFEPGPPEQGEPTNIDGLVTALLESLDLSRQPETAGRCREVAKRFSWSTVGPLYGELYGIHEPQPTGRSF